jgi:hypothetical protein
MAIIACARRKTDGLLTWAQVSPQAPDQSAIIQKGINSFGGVADDWEYIELSDEQYQSMRAAMPGRAFLTLSTDPEGIVTAELAVKAAPGLSSDKAQIEDDGIDEATITFEVGAASFSGDVSFTISAPDGSQQTIVKTAAAGVASVSLTTLLTGAIVIDARAEDFGDGVIVVEGI